MRKSFRNGYNGDLKDVVMMTLLGWVVLAFCVSIGTFVAQATIQEKNTSYERYCEFIEFANTKLDADGRKFLAEYVPKYAEYINDDGYFAEQEAPSDTSLGQFAANNRVFLLILLACIISVPACFAYGCWRDSDYYFADLPLKSFRGWFVLITCFMAWPVFIISGILFWRYIKQECTVRLPEIEPRYCMEDYVKFCQKRANLSKAIAQESNILAELQRALESASRTSDTATLKTIQAEISKQCAKLNNLRARAKTMAEEVQQEGQLMHDFEEIKNMRGVKKIFTDSDGNLIITVRVVYDYNGVLYDIGDFDIKIFDVVDISTFIVFRKRYSMTSYLYGASFCFGEIRLAIEEYLNNNRIVEAVELIIESINHINDGDIDEIPNRYKRIKS